jgi:hypothetical protein
MLTAVMNELAIFVTGTGRFSSSLKADNFAGRLGDCLLTRSQRYRSLARDWDTL